MNTKVHPLIDVDNTLNNKHIPILNRAPDIQIITDNNTQVTTVNSTQDFNQQHNQVNQLIQRLLQIA